MGNWKKGDIITAEMLNQKSGGGNVKEEIIVESTLGTGSEDKGLLFYNTYMPGAPVILDADYYFRAKGVDYKLDVLEDEEFIFFGSHNYDVDHDAPIEESEPSFAVYITEHSIADLDPPIVGGGGSDPMPIGPSTKGSKKSYMLSIISSENLDGETVDFLYKTNETPASSGPLRVTFTAIGEMELTADVSPAEVVAAYAGGAFVYGDINGYCVNLVYANDEGVLFSSVEGNIKSIDDGWEFD